MADQIQANDGMMLGSGEKAWHGKGVVIPGLATAAEALVHANLGWKVEKAPLSYHIGENAYHIQDKVATYRSDDKTQLGIVGADYTILQNDETFGIFDPVVQAGEAVYETAGSLFGGRKVFVTAKIPDLIHVGTGDDVTEAFLLVTNSHDGTGSVTVKLINTRVVCNNTLTAALGEKGREFKIRHSMTMHERTKKATEAMGLASKRMKEKQEAYNAMLNHSMDDADVRAFLETCFKQVVATPNAEADNILADAAKKERKRRDNYLLIKAGELYETSPTVDRGTLWGAFNAVTETLNHHRRSRNHTGGNDPLDNKIDSLFYGQTMDLIDNAFVESGKILVASGRHGKGAKEMAMLV